MGRIEFRASVHEIRDTSETIDHPDGPAIHSARLGLTTVGAPKGVRTMEDLLAAIGPGTVVRVIVEEARGDAVIRREAITTDRSLVIGPDGTADWDATLKNLIERSDMAFGEPAPPEPEPRADIQVPLCPHCKGRLEASVSVGGIGTDDRLRLLPLMALELTCRACAASHIYEQEPGQSIGAVIAATVAGLHPNSSGRSPLVLRSWGRSDAPLDAIIDGNREAVEPPKQETWRDRPSLL